MAKKKKMTLKEFKQIFNDAGMDFDIWGYEGILNLLMIAEQHLEQETESDLLKKMHKDRGMYIYNSLKERGYYE